MSYNATYSAPEGAIENYANAQLSEKFGPEIINYFSGSPSFTPHLHPPHTERLTRRRLTLKPRLLPPHKQQLPFRGPVGLVPAAAQCVVVPAVDFSRVPALCPLYLPGRARWLSVRGV